MDPKPRLPEVWSEFVTQWLGIFREVRLLLREKRRCMRHEREASGGHSSWSGRAIERALKEAEQTAQQFSELAKEFHADECVKAEAELTALSESAAPAPEEATASPAAPPSTPQH